MKLAIVHDFLNQYGGAERVVGYFKKIYPEAPIYTSIYFPESTFDLFKEQDIKTSFMQRIPGVNKHYRNFFFIYPLAFKRFNLSSYEIVITSSSSFSNFINKGETNIVISYCYTPARFLWDFDKYMGGEHIAKGFQLIIKPLINNLRKRDIDASKKVDYFIAISKFIKKKIKRIYNRDAKVIYPPIELGKYRYKERKEDFYIVVSRLKRYKRIDIAIQAFNKLNKKLIVVGTGENEINLKKMAKDNIKFLGKVEENKLLDLYSDARALIFTGEEDFGLTPLEAQASGTPAIAFKGGGALETILEGKTGFLYERQEVDSLVDVIKEFEKNRVDQVICRKNAAGFDLKYFKKQIVGFISNIYESEFN